MHRLAIFVAALLLVVAVAAPAQACPTHDVSLPTGPGDGQPREVKELLDTPFVKLVSITLRKGTKLQKHKAGLAITLQAISGSGKVTTAGTTDSLAPGHVVLIAPGSEHEVVPDGAADLVLLVHFLKMGGATATPEAAATCAHGDHAATDAAHKH